MRRYLAAHPLSLWAAVELVLRAAVVVALIFVGLRLGDLTAAQQASDCVAYDTYLGTSSYQRCDSLIADRLDKLIELQPACQTVGEVFTAPVNCVEEILAELRFARLHPGEQP